MKCRMRGNWRRHWNMLMHVEQFAQLRKEQYQHSQPIQMHLTLLTNPRPNRRYRFLSFLYWYIYVLPSSFFACLLFLFLFLSSFSVFEIVNKPFFLFYFYVLSYSLYLSVTITCFPMLNSIPPLKFFYINLKNSQSYPIPGWVKDPL